MDEHFMKMRGFPLTWFDYYAWAKGPVAPEVYAIKNGSFSRYVSSHLTKEKKRAINSVIDQSYVLAQMNLSFSKNEITEIDRLIDAYKNKNADELSDLTHVEGSVWSRAVVENNLQFDENNGKSDCKIDLSVLFREEDWRRKLYEDARKIMELQKQLSSNRNPGNKIELHIVTPSEREKYLIPSYSPAIP